MIRELDVYLNRELSGKLSLNGNDNMVFAYHDNATTPISLGMRLLEGSFDDDHCEAFFGGLLPEGDGARKALGKRFGISADNTFSLLRAIGAECAGALSILEGGSSPAPEQPGLINILSEAELAQHIRELPKRPLFVGVNGLRLSLSGVQDKAAVSLSPEGIGIPVSGPTTHILKPDLQRAPGVIYCEHLCLQIAARLGLDAATVELRRAEDQVFLLVQRYDREQGKQRSELNRIHQEDFCQALAIPSKRKYQEDGGPKLVDCFHLLDKTSAPAAERLKLLKAVIFNFLVGNMDAHGKNFSLLHRQKGTSLAPLYDVVCTLAFPDYSKNLAMDIGDYFKPEEIYAFHWRAFCEDIGYAFPAFKKLAKKIYSALPTQADQAYAEMEATGWSHPVCKRTVEIIKANCAEMNSRLNA